MATKTFARPRRRAFPALGAVVAATLVFGAPAVSAAPASTASVTVNASNSLGTIPANGIGLNTAVYDGHMNDAQIVGSLRAGGIDALRYPGGSYSDIYNWQTQTAVDGGFVAAGTSFAQFAGTVRGAGAGSIVTVNYGTGTTSLAAAWVKAAASEAANVKYWEIGNEVYGNGTYSSNWETDGHCRTSRGGSPVTIGKEPSRTYNCGPAEYARNVLSYRSAIKAASSGSKVCAVLTTPGFWPDNVTTSEYPHTWNQTVLSTLGNQVDCVIVHYYPAQGNPSTASMLNDPADIPGVVSTVRSEIQQYTGMNPANVPIIVTETDSQVDPDTQPSALFAADMYMSWLENSVVNVDWWDEHNGPGSPSVVGGARDYGDLGMFASGSGGEPAANTPFSSYYGVAMLARLGSPGDTMVRSSSNSGLLKVHAVRHGNNLDVLIDNEDPSNSYSVNLNYSGFTPSGGATIQKLADNATSITSTTQTSTSSVTVSPYSLTVVRIPGS
ncbi:MAG TPA: alpha-L-arabinofuranosidase [Pseudonocardiaceae bacterium]|nr:alpha-L-arabinofuranosidase [Pseudonocardiaceae bacterium]